MAHLDLSLFGGLAIWLDGQPVGGFVSDKARALLAYLAVEAERPQRREALAALLWPERPESVARASLSQAVFNLRSILGDRARAGTPEHGRPAIPFLSVSGEAIQFNPTSDHRVDATTFTSLLQACAEHAHRVGGECVACVQRLSEAVALYRGSFLQDLAIGDSVPFEEWATVRREQLHRQALEVLQRLVAYYEVHGDAECGLAYAWRQVELDPWREEAQRQLMRLLAFSGRRSEALMQYETCRRLLAKELDAAPSAETTRLYEDIRSGAIEPPPPLATSARATTPAPLIGGLEAPTTRSVLFVARERELAYLDTWLKEALVGQGRVGFVVGEPGSGKTMLMQEFAQQAMEGQGDLLVASGSCNAYSGVGDPYLPFLEVLQMLSGDVESRLAGGGISREHGRRLWGALPTAAQALVQVGPELIDLLVPGEGLLARALAFAPTGAPWRARLEELLRRRAASPQRADLQQADLFEQYTRVLQALAREHPLLLVLDDLQWADAGSISLLFHLGRRLAGQRILVLGAYRPEEVALGRGGEQHPLAPVINEFCAALGESQVDLAQAEGRCLVEALLDAEPNCLGAAFRETLYRHTGGQALFTVELWRGLQERGDLLQDEAGRWTEGPSLDWERLPARVEAVIAQHIARLPREWQELLTVASVEGEKFTAEVVARVQGEQERVVIRTLSGALSREHHLVQALTLRRLGEQRLSGYRFRHYLFQSYLYQRLDEVQRVRLHEEVGVALEALYGARPRSAQEDFLQGAASTWDVLLASQQAEMTAIAPQLARHFQAARLPARAVAYLQQAGERAASFGAYQEAIAHGNKALELLSTMPDTPERARAEYMVQIGLNEALKYGRSLAAPEAGRALARAYELAQRLDDPPLLCNALYNLYWFHLNRADIRLAMRFVQQLIALEERELPRYLPDAYLCLATDLFVYGDFPAARERLEALLAPDAPPVFAAGFESVARIHLAFALWCLGYPDQALQLSQRNLSLAYETEGPWAIAYALSDSRATFHQLRREVNVALEGAEQLLALTSEERWLWLRALGMILKGWAHAHEGRAVEGLAEMRQGLVDWRATGMGARVPHWLALLAEGYALAGRAEEGLGAIAEALEHVERTEERYYEAELYRLRGELLLKDEGRRACPERSEGMKDEKESSAEECFCKAIAVARRQVARLWELRATMSLCRLWQSQGKREEAREALAAIYGWFTEGFDTPDLQEAKALLGELAAGEEESAGRE